MMEIGAFSQETQARLKRVKAGQPEVDRDMGYTELVEENWHLSDIEVSVQ
jgi:hypothetical protein